MNEELESIPHHRWERRMLFGVLMAPVVWIVQLTVSYSLVMQACASGSALSLHIASVIFLVLAGIGTWIAWKNWLLVGKRTEAQSGYGDRPLGRFMSILGIAISSLFFLIILVQSIPSFIQNPCTM